MITDEIMEAIEIAINCCDDRMAVDGMISLRNMLGDFSEDEWLNMTPNKRRDWVKKFLIVATKK